MCVHDAEEVSERMEDMGLPRNADADGEGSVRNSFHSFTLESMSEDSIAADRLHMLNNFLPVLRSGEWSDIGGRPDMEDTHICIRDLAMKFGYTAHCKDVISFYGVFDGHGGKGAAQFVRDQLPRIIVENAYFPLDLEQAVLRSFKETDSAIAKSYLVESTLSSGTTALIAMISGRSLLVANAGDCRAVLSRRGVAIEKSEDHRACCIKERQRVESLGGYIDGGGYLNGELNVTRALGDWHIKGLKEWGEVGLLSAEPEVKLTTLTNEDEFLIIGSDGIWDVFSSQNAVDFARRKLREHNNVKICCRDIINEAKKRGATDNLTVVVVCFNSEPPPTVTVERPRVGLRISAEGRRTLNQHFIADC